MSIKENPVIAQIVDAKQGAGKLFTSGEAFEALHSLRSRPEVETLAVVGSDIFADETFGSAIIVAKDESEGVIAIVQDSDTLLLTKQQVQSLAGALSVVTAKEGA